MPVLPDRIYNIFKWLCIIVLPALAVLISKVFEVWGIPYGPQISVTIEYIAVFLGAVLCISQIGYTKAQATPVVEEVTEDGYVVLYQKNKFSVGDKLEVMNFDGTNSVCTVSEIINQYGESVDSAPHPKEKLKVKLDIDGNVKPEPGVIIRQK